MKESTKRDGEIFLVFSPYALTNALNERADRRDNGMYADYDVVGIFFDFYNGQQYEATHIVDSEQQFEELKQIYPDAMIMLRANMSDLFVPLKGLALQHLARRQDMRHKRAQIS